MEKYFKVKVNESFEYNLKNSDLEILNLIKLSTTINNNKSFNVVLERTDFNNKEYVLEINSNHYTIKIETQLDLLIKKMGFSVSTSKKENDIKAPMPGLILSVNVKEGQEVVEGETLLILEAMKMENIITASKDGKIKSINIKCGATVEKGELMVKIV
jgi:biotin carboxyl carrier protein